MKNQEINAWDTLSVHGSRVSKITTENDCATFVLDNGMWLLKEHPQNTFGDAVATVGEAKLTFKGIKNPMITVVKRRHVAGPLYLHWPRSCKWEEFVGKINSGEWTLEFDAEDRPVERGVVYDGFIWLKGNDKYSWDVRFSFKFAETVYEWNDIDGSRTFSDPENEVVAE